MTETDKFKNQYRIPSTRWAAWDYGCNAAYFITICAAQHIHHFGKIENGIVTLSILGQAAHQCWQEIPLHFPFVILDEFIITPNHLHGIVIINKNVETQNLASLQVATSSQKFGTQSQNIASIVRGFKIGVTKFARPKNLSFEWQPRYYDRVIRNMSELDRIRKYIYENPLRLGEDEYNLGSKD